MNNITEAFTNIYDNNLWGGVIGGRGSGPGSSPENNLEYTCLLIDTILKNQIRTVLDYGCGDWQFSKFIPWATLVDSYTGVDVVSSVISTNQQYATDTVKFILNDETWQWPAVDLIICKDVLQHLPNAIVSTVLNDMRRHSKMILTTNDIASTIFETEMNCDCSAGGWRLLDLTLPPWNLNADNLGTIVYSDSFTKQVLLIKNDN